MCISKLLGGIEHSPSEVTQALLDIEKFDNRINRLRDEMNEAIKSSDYDSLVRTDRAFRVWGVRIYERCRKALSDLTGETFTPDVAARLSPIFYKLLLFNPEFGHPALSGILVGLRKGASGFRHTEDYEKLLKKITRLIAQTKPSYAPSMENLLLVYERLHTQAKDICKGRSGIAREKEVRRVFPELKGRPLVLKGGRIDIEPSWVAFNVMAALGNSNANTMNKLVVSLNKIRKGRRLLQDRRSKNG